MCDANQHPAPFQIFTLRLPRPGATSVNVIRQDFRGDQGTVSRPLGVPGQGADLTFTLASSSLHPYVVGEITLGWTFDVPEPEASAHRCECNAPQHESVCGGNSAR